MNLYLFLDFYQIKNQVKIQIDIYNFKINKILLIEIWDVDWGLGPITNPNLLATIPIYFLKFKYNLKNKYF